MSKTILDRVGPTSACPAGPATSRPSSKRAAKSSHLLERTRSLRDLLANFGPYAVHVQDLHRDDLDRIIERDPRDPAVDEYIAELKQASVELCQRLAARPQQRGIAATVRSRVKVELCPGL